ncbi:MAG: cyclic nucleotide-binding domain-containing protein [Xanthobacteraceae bacterium]
MSTEEEIALLERLPILHPLGGGALRSLAIAAEIISLQPGEVLFTAGETADAAYVVEWGSLTLKPQYGDELIAGPGTLLGEAALFVETRRPVTATARESTAIMRIPRTTFLKVLDSYPDAAWRLRELIASRTDQWAHEMENIRAALSGTLP